MIGYQDAEGVYLLFDLAKAEVLRVKGQGGLGGASSAILYTQLRELGLIASKNRDSSTLSIKVQGRPIRVLHLKRVALEPAEGEGA